MTIIRYSAIRSELTCRKRVVSDTGWKMDALPPRFSPFEHTRPALARWEWRSFNLMAEDGTGYRMLVEVAPALDKWKAMLIRIADGMPPVVIMRFEDQPGKTGGGVHIHAHCGERPDLAGAASIEMPYTLPDHGRLRRRRVAWTKALFCRAAGDLFRTDPISGQEEMPL